MFAILWQPLWHHRSHVYFYFTVGACTSTVNNNQFIACITLYSIRWCFTLSERCSVRAGVYVWTWPKASSFTDLWSSVEADKAHAEVYCKPHQVTLHDARIGFTLENTGTRCYPPQGLHRGHSVIWALLISVAETSQLERHERFKASRVGARCCLLRPVSSPPPGKWPSERPSPRWEARTPAPRWRTCPRRSPSARWSSTASCPPGRYPADQEEWVRVGRYDSTRAVFFSRDSE